MRLSSVNITEMYNSLAYRQNTSSFALKTSTKDSTEGSHIRSLTEPVRTLQMTNATIQKVCNLTLNSFSGTHRHTLGGEPGGSTHRGVIIYVELHRLGVSPVNHIYYVHLRWGYVFRDMGGFGCWGIWWGLEVDG